MLVLKLQESSNSFTVRVFMEINIFLIKSELQIGCELTIKLLKPNFVETLNVCFHKIHSSTITVFSVVTNYSEKLFWQHLQCNWEYGSNIYFEPLPHSEITIHNLSPNENIFPCQSQVFVTVLLHITYLMAHCTWKLQKT